MIVQSRGALRFGLIPETRAGKARECPESSWDRQPGPVRGITRNGTVLTGTGTEWFTRGHGGAEGERGTPL